MSKFNVNVIGAGRVGQTLLGLLRPLPNYTIQDVMSTRLSSAQKAVQSVGTGRAVESFVDLRPADIWILSVPDTQISKVATEISGIFSKKETAGKAPTAFHCSGFFSAAELAPLRQPGWLLASVHPVLSFAEPAVAIRKFNGTYCGTEGDDAALEVIHPMLRKMGAQPFQIGPETKSLYHAAAVFSNNFTVVLQAIAREAWAEAGVPEPVARELNATLLRATCENVIAKGPRDALTGPAARGDQQVVTQQGNDVEHWHPAAGSLYKEMSLLARALKERGKTRA